MTESNASAKCEPNLTPLLDVVLQLIMFFMLCANFVMEQVNESIKLPQAIAAKSLDKTVDDYIILNVENVDGVAVTTIAGQRLDSPGKVLNYMKDEYERDKRRMVDRGKVKEWEDGKGRSLIILRADAGQQDREPKRAGCTYKQVHDVMEACKFAGYTEIQLRTIKADPDAK